MKNKSLLFSLAALFSIQSSVFAQKAAENYFIDGVQEYSSGQYSKASDLFDKAISADSANDAAYYYKGLSQMYLNQKEEALDNFRKAVSMDSSNYWYRDRLAFAYSVSGDIDAAAAEYERLTRSFPKKSDAYYSLVNIYLGQNNLEKAVGAISAIENFQGKSDATVMTKYRILLHQQKQDEALETLKEYSREYSSPQVLSMLGDHETGLYNDSLAIAYYDEALALDSSYSPALLGKAEVYRVTRKYPEYFTIVKEIMADDELAAGAKADYLSQLIQHVDPKFVQNNRAQIDTTFDIMLGHHPSDTSAIQTAGIYYYTTGRHEKAKAIFRQGMDENPDDVKSTMYYIQALASMEDYPALSQECEAASRRFPGSTEFDDMLIYAEYKQEHYQAVIDKCEEMILKSPKDSAVCLQSYSTIGDCHHLMGDSAKAYKSYDKALKINPDYAPVLNNYAYYLSLDGKKLGKAYKMSRKTIEQEPDYATYLDTFGWILHLMGKDIEAKPFFKHAMLYGGKESATVLAHYAIVLEALGEDSLSEVYKKQARTKAAEGAE